MTEQEIQSINRKISVLYNQHIKIDSVVSQLLKIINDEFSN